MVYVVNIIRSVAANIGPRSDPRKTKKANYGSGKETLRLRANGEAQIEDEVSSLA